ncbi:MAG: AEC family transporter [candidate division KSB1 bacterium]|nr:AEC family transporter [candidate division KSB1 bacterium]
MIIWEVIVPTFLIVFLGYAAGRAASFDLRSLSNLTLYVLTPSLVFHRLYVSRLDAGMIGRIAAYSGAIVAAMYLVSAAVSGWFKLREQDAVAFRLASALFNVGNMGLQVVVFAFGEQGLTYAAVMVVCHVLLTNTVGVFVAARASLDRRQALRQVFALPAVYAIALGFLLGHARVPLPPTLLRPVELLGNAAIPVNTALLGLQLSRSRAAENVRLAAVVAGLRLLLAPALGAILLRLMGFSGLPLRVLLLQTAMPSAVYSSILSQRYEANAALASAAVLVSTLLSALSLSALLLLLAG